MNHFKDCAFLIVSAHKFQEKKSSSLCACTCNSSLFHVRSLSCYECQFTAYRVHSKGFNTKMTFIASSVSRVDTSCRQSAKASMSDSSQLRKTPAPYSTVLISASAFAEVRASELEMVICEGWLNIVEESLASGR